MPHVVDLSALSSEVPREQIRLDVVNPGENPRFQIAYDDHLVQWFYHSRPGGGHPLKWRGHTQIEAKEAPRLRQGIIPDLSQIMHLELSDHLHAMADDDEPVAAHDIDDE